MCIIWLRVSSPNLVRSPDFSVYVRKTKFTNGRIATDYHHNFKQNCNHFYIVTLTANKLFYMSIIGLCIEFSPKIMANVSLIFGNFCKTMKVSTCIQIYKKGKFIMSDLNYKN